MNPKLAVFAEFVALLTLAGCFLSSSSSFKDSGGKYLHVAYLVCLAISYGMQFWVYFVVGFIMRQHLPRKMFGHVQSFIFPIFFLISSLLLAISLSISLLVHPFDTWRCAEYTKISGLATAYAISLLLQLQFPFVYRTMMALYAVEKDYDVLDQVGILSKEQKEKLGQDEKWRKVSREFLVAHVISTILGILMFCSTSVAVVYCGRLLNDI